VLVFLVITSIILRLAYVFVLHPPLTWSDAGIYDGTAGNFVSGHGYSLPVGTPFAGREPGYVLFFLIPVYFLFGHNFLMVQILQIILSATLTTVIYYFIKQELNKNTAFLSALFFVLHPLFVSYTGEILTEIPFTFLLFISLWVIYNSLKKESLKLCFVGGLVLGLATLTRFISIFLPFFLIIIIYFFYRNSKKIIYYGATLIVAMLISVSPWVIRNYIVFDTFIFGRAGASEIYWSGSYIPWDGEWLGYQTPPLKELSPDSNTATLAIDKILMPEFWKNIKSDPAGVMKVWLKKPVKLFIKGDFNNVLAEKNKMAIYGQQINFYAIRYLFTAINLVLIAFALLGYFVLGKRNRPLLVLCLLIITYFMLFYLPMNPDSRYKMPLLPFIFIGAAVGINYIYEKSSKLYRSEKKFIVFNVKK
jgi:4-amino-4-deoxy-L-arabinose transferase-like glycosyltransferase